MSGSSVQKDMKGRRNQERKEAGKEETVQQPGWRSNESTARRLGEVRGKEVSWRKRFDLPVPSQDAWVWSGALGYLWRV